MKFLTGDVGGAQTHRTPSSFQPGFSPSSFAHVLPSTWILLVLPLLFCTQRTSWNLTSSEKPSLPRPSCYWSHIVHILPSRVPTGLRLGPDFKGSDTFWPYDLLLKVGAVFPTSQCCEVPGR